jgi:hypothetical protein
MKGCEGTVLRRSWGPSKTDVHTKECYELTRKNIAEFGGRSTTAAYIKRVLAPLKGVLDYNLNSVLSGLLKPMQEADLESTWGNRNVLISRKPFLLEGLNLNRRNSFDAVISSPVQVTVNKPAGTAKVITPQLLPSVNFFPPSNFSVCRITALLGIAPDFYYAEPRYKPLPAFAQWKNVTASSDWLLASKGCPSSELKLSLCGSLPEEGFSLLVAVGVEVGTPLMGEMVPLRYMNWPVAGPVSNYLESISGHLTPSCLRVFGHSNHIDPQLLQEIEKLKGYASKMDIDEGVLEEVNEILQKHFIAKEAINIINQVKTKITDESDMAWTHYDTAKQLREELELYIRQFQNGDVSSLEKVKFLFLPTATLQEHSIANGWPDEYLALAEKFDSLYSMTNHS